MLTDEIGCKMSSCCEWNTWEEGDASYDGAGRCWSAIKQEDTCYDTSEHIAMRAMRTDVDCSDRDLDCCERCDQNPCYPSCEDCYEDECYGKDKFYRCVDSCEYAKANWSQ